jgi:O-antigen/teichoic acid export membrane protein
VRLLNYVSFAGLAFNFILNWLLIPKYQALGATYATIATQCLVSGIIFLACTKIFYLPKKDFVNTKVIGFIVISIMSFYLLSWLNPFTWIWNMVAAILVSVSSVFVIKLINLKDWLQLLKSGK